jgi:DNA-3-methyladenine glycosylase I
VEKQTSYCQYVNQLPLENLHRQYHDHQYGFKLKNDNELFGRLILEINQAGLSWTTILNKKENFKTAYSNFNIHKIASYSKKEINQLLSNKGIVRNNLKIKAIIFNAQKVVEIQNEFGSFYNWLNNKKGYDLTNWVTLFKKTFKFTGGEITKEFLMSTGFVDGAHIKTCPIYSLIKCKTSSS